MSALAKLRRRAPEAAFPGRLRSPLLTMGMLLCAACLAAAMTGPYSLTPAEIADILLNEFGLDTGTPVSPQQSAVFLDIRLPRVVLGIMAGSGLGLAGAVMQGLFRNPLADPGLLGVSSGAAVGAAVAIVLLPAPIALGFLPELAVPLSAFAGGLAATLCVYALSRREGHLSLATMLLAGIAVNALAGALLGLMSYLSTDEQLRNLTFWNLGSLGGVDWRTLTALAWFLVPGAGLLFTLAAPLNVLMLGESEAHHLGVDLARVKRRGILFGSLIVGTLVSVCGIIGFVSLVAPHLVRLAVGPDHRRVLPGAALCGASLLVIADLGSRTLAAPAEVPVGILTALTGTPFFLWLLKNRAGGGRLS